MGGIHLKSTKASKGEKMRLQQAQEVRELLKNKFPGRKIILCGDLNGECPERKTVDYEPKAYPWLVAKEGGNLKSAYKESLGKEPLFTSWKLRKGKTDKEFKYTIDFVFTSPEVMALSALKMPSEDNFTPGILLPNEKCGSDHLPLV